MQGVATGKLPRFSCGIVTLLVGVSLTGLAGCLVNSKGLARGLGSGGCCDSGMGCCVDEIGEADCGLVVQRFFCPTGSGSCNAWVFREEKVGHGLAS